MSVYNECTYVVYASVDAALSMLRKIILENSHKFYSCMETNRISILELDELVGNAEPSKQCV